MNMCIQKPNFFIIGAPKCGTTSMSEYLRKHPDVFFSDPKEPHYFNTDFSYNQRKFHSKEEYLKLFEGAASYKAVGEGSVFYLYSKEAVPNILSFNPDAKFIVMLRNPVDMFYSFYYQMRLNMVEDKKTPADAWFLQSERRNGEDIPKFCPDRKMLDYEAICKLGNQLVRLHEYVSDDRIFYIYLEDMKKDTLAVYRKTLKFLNVPYDGRRSFPVINKKERNHSNSMRYVINLLGGMKRDLGIKKGLGLLNKMKEMLKKTDKVRKTSSKLNNILRECFEDDIRLMESITNRDLSNWH